MIIDTTCSVIERKMREKTVMEEQLEFVFSINSSSSDNFTTGSFAAITYYEFDDKTFSSNNYVQMSNLRWNFQVHES